MLRLSLMVLFLSCTSKVEPSVCKWTQGGFSSAQRVSTAMQSVDPTVQKCIGERQTARAANVEWHQVSRFVLPCR